MLSSDMQSCTKKANVMYIGQGNKEQVSQDLKDRFLIYILFIAVDKKYLHQQNIGKEKISASQKYWFQQNIAAGKISAKKKYRFQQNIGGN